MSRTSGMSGWPRSVSTAVSSSADDASGFITGASMPYFSTKESMMPR